VYGGDEKALRQTLIALATGSRLDEHEKPATPSCTSCWVAFRGPAGRAPWDGTSGDLILIPPALHLLLASEDETVLLTEVPRAYTA